MRWCSWECLSLEVSILPLQRTALVPSRPTLNRFGFGETQCAAAAGLAGISRAALAGEEPMRVMGVDGVRGILGCLRGCESNGSGFVAQLASTATEAHPFIQALGLGVTEAIERHTLDGGICLGRVNRLGKTGNGLFDIGDQRRVAAMAGSDEFNDSERLGGGLHLRGSFFTNRLDKLQWLLVSI